MLFSRNNWSKKLQRISETRNIEFFVLTSLIQFLVMIFFYLRLWNRFTIIIHSNDSDGCSNDSISSNNYPFSFVLELLFLVLFQVFQFNFALNAVVTQYCAQVSIIALMNGIVSLYGFIHLLEIRRVVAQISASCAITPDPQYLAYDVPFIFSSLVFAITMGYFAYKVRRDLSGRIYKKIGLDMTMQVYFKIRLIFMMLMKLNLFFMVVTTTMTTFLFIYITNELSSNVVVFKTLIIIQFFVVFAQFAAQFVVHRAVPKESFSLMKLFNILWFIVLIDWFIFLVGSVILATDGAWILLYFTVPYCYVGIITLIYAWKTTDTFNQGLREYVGLRLNRNQELIIKIEDVEDYRPRKVSSKIGNHYQTDEIKKPDDVLIFKTPDDDAMVDNDNYQTEKSDDILILKKPDDALL